MDQDYLRSRFNPEGSLLRRQQHRMTEMLLVLDGICRKHNIQYWLCSGTLLGAVRHGGYIPWDDDLDVEMLRPDYERLMKILPQELPDNLQLQTPETDKGYFYAYAKLRDRRSLLRETNSYDRIFDMQGIYIDIFPMERIPQCLRWVSCRTLGGCYKVLKRKDISDDEARRRVRRIYWFNKHIVFPVLRALAFFIPTKTIRYSFGIPYDDIRLASYLFPLQKISFEGHMMPAPADCDPYLRDKFGDYKSLPDLDTLHLHSSSLTIDD
ncbi:MAG: LicD family protein [Bacteroidaceae bacterium]|nr:LicD family protein [Bacteroidaceae bacterium]